MSRTFVISIMMVSAITAYAQDMIIDHDCAFLEPIPASAINQARETLHIAYGHTSHGSQLTTGMTALADQDETLIGWKGDIYCWQHYSQPGVFDCLDLHDYFRGGDLGHNGSLTWALSTRDYLDNDPNSDDINVIMWSWCGGCSDNTPQGIQVYLDEMTALEVEYPGVNFVYMTGHRDIWNNETLMQNNQQIRDYCIDNDKILFDFADIESYDPDGVYYEYVNDNCDYYDADMNYLGNWATEWQNSHIVGVDWFDCYAAHTEPLNGNRKAYASWWMLCRIAGWDGPGEVVEASISVAGCNVVLSWTPYDGATGYRVYSSVNPYAGFEEDQSGTYDGVTWTAPQQVPIRFYRVTALLE